MDQITTVINISATCEQSIMTECSHSALSNFGWWNDRNDQKREYWHGDFSDGKNGCKCAKDETGCHTNIFETKVSFKCNKLNKFWSEITIK